MTKKGANDVVVTWIDIVILKMKKKNSIHNDFFNNAIVDNYEKFVLWQRFTASPWQMTAQRGVTWTNLLSNKRVRGGSQWILHLYPPMKKDLGVGAGFQQFAAPHDVLHRMM